MLVKLLADISLAAVTGLTVMFAPVPAVSLVVSVPVAGLPVAVPASVAVPVSATALGSPDADVRTWMASVAVLCRPPSSVMVYLK